MKSPLVSVITTTYNRAGLLPRAMDSVLRQTHENLELIVVDDGSTDDTGQVIARYADSRLRYIPLEKNRGIGAARAEGVFHACGEWVAFLDSDDLWYPEKLEADLEILTRHPEIDVLIDNFRNINYIEGMERSGFEQVRPALERTPLAELESGLIILNPILPEGLLTVNLTGSASILMFRRNIFRQAGNFNTALSGPEDFEMLWRAALAGGIFAYHTRLLVERHKGEKSISAAALDFVPALLKALDLCEDTARQAGRIDLLRHIDHARHRAHYALVSAYGRSGKRRLAWKSFLSSFRYGTSLEIWFALGMAVAGPNLLKAFKAIRSNLGPV